VKICSPYGAGFYYIPGTDTCLKVGGWVRFETGYGYNGSFTTEFYNSNGQNRFTNDNNWRAKGVISFDAREQSEYGTVRSYATLGVSNNNVGDNPTGPYINRWFIQFAGFTIGHATSFFDFYSIGANQYGFVTGSSDTGDGGWDVFGYTAQFGNGFSASVAAEVQRRTRIINANAARTITGSNTVSGTYMGHDYPDVVANLRIDQAWGSAQVMGAMHQVNGLYYGGAAPASGHPGDKWGYAVGAGIKLNAPMIGRGDYFQAEVDYTKGASRYSNMTATTWDYSMWQGSTIGFGFNSDAVYGGAVGAGATSLELTETWAVNAAYTHFWTPAWKSTLWGSYMAVRYNSSANNMMCSGGGTTAAAAAGCDMDWNVWGIGLRTEWAATKNLSIGLEVLYANLDSAAVGAGAIAVALPAGKTAATAVDDMDTWAVRFRVNRNFYP
jgi:hypothetical protein